MTDNPGLCLCCGDWYEALDGQGLCEECAKLSAECRAVHDIDAYQADALRTWNSGGLFYAHLVNAALGLTGEAGEVAEHIKKTVYHGHDLDREAIADELGDVLYYAAVMAREIGYSLHAIADHNIAKLRERYPDGFDSVRSKERAR